MTDGLARETGLRGVRDVVVVMTAHRPEARIRDVVASLLEQAARVVVVDNTPEGVPDARSLLDGTERVEVLSNGHNAGLAVALNRGLERIGDAPAVLLSDQDSVLRPGVVDAMLDLLADDATIGAVGPAPWDPVENRYLDPRTRMRPDLADMAVIITSGMLLRREALDQVGRFREDFFVDCVDQEFCLRVKESGWRVVQDKRILIDHSLGATRWHSLGLFKFRATHHAAWRIYWVARNTVIMLREHARRDPRWAITAVAILGYWALTILLVEPPRLRRLGVLLRGLRDGVSGRVDTTMTPGRRPA